MVYRADSTGRRHRPYTDADIAGPAPWPAILDSATWQAVRAILTDPARTVGPGNTPRWLGSRIYQCGICDNGSTLVVSGSTRHGKRYFRYTCQNGYHLARAAELCDAYVEATITARLEREDAAGILTGPDQPRNDAMRLREEISAFRELLNEQARLHARGLIDGRQLAAGSAELRASLQAAESQLAAMEVTSPLAGIAGRPDAASIWEQLDLGRKRAILRTLATVTIHPVPKGRRRGGAYFDYSSIAINWRT
jgi:hypothetical protein